MTLPAATLVNRDELSADEVESYLRRRPLTDPLTLGTLIEQENISIRQRKAIRNVAFVAFHSADQLVILIGKFPRKEQALGVVLQALTKIHLSQFFGQKNIEGRAEFTLIFEAHAKEVLATLEPNLRSMLSARFERSNSLGK